MMRSRRVRAVSSEIATVQVGTIQNWPLYAPARMLPSPNVSGRSPDASRSAATMGSASPSAPAHERVAPLSVKVTPARGVWRSRSRKAIRTCSTRSRHRCSAMDDPGAATTSMWGIWPCSIAQPTSTIRACSPWTTAPLTLDLPSSMIMEKPPISCFRSGRIMGPEVLLGGRGTDEVRPTRAFLRGSAGRGRPRRRRGRPRSRRACRGRGSAHR